MAAFPRWRHAVATMTAVHDILNHTVTCESSQSSKMQKSQRKKTQKYPIVGSPCSDSKNADATLKHFAESDTWD
uniref:Uncharacterized protein n=1 Tax=Timema genevievae TaxID=629358 RepID=A0A7R9JNF5_TIMGE|nr:unnamed protein product [Timema genevievae]